MKTTPGAQRRQFQVKQNLPGRNRKKYKIRIIENFNIRDMTEHTPNLKTPATVRRTLIGQNANRCPKTEDLSEDSSL